MRRFFIIAMTGVMLSLPGTAQNYRGSRYYNRNTGRLDYNNRSCRGYYGNRDAYYGFRIGPAFTTVNSDNEFLDGGKVQTGLNVGFAAGFGLTNRAPLYLETGLYYTEKGGKNDKKGLDYTYNLNYIEIPLVLKYVYNVDRNISVQPFVGGYLACGVGGKIKDFGEREAYSSFSDDDYAFRRFDGGLRMGIGLGIDMFYADLTYDLGLSNIGHDYFDESKNSALMLNVGVNF